MSKIPLALLSALVIYALAPAGNASAQQGGTDLRAFGQLYLGLAGEVDAEVEALGTSSQNEVDLDASPGFGAGVDFGLHEYVALGGLFRFLSMSSDDIVVGPYVIDVDVTVLDFDLLPRLRYPFDKKGEIYLAVPVGLSLFIPDADDADDELGWNISMVIGGLYAVSDNFGLFAEIGYFVHNGSTSRTVLGIDVETSLSAGQLGLSIGAAYID